MGSCAAPSAKGDDKFITTDYLQQCPRKKSDPKKRVVAYEFSRLPSEVQTEIDEAIKKIIGKMSAGE
ncbi:hypothetical protein OFN20_23345, partial [Escherichia coli]|nr:hypothetical protein [Escherichia coli]MCV5783863.1 hypothetical protein [Escherichia coli]